MKLHFMGIGGSGISGVARLAEKMGNMVTGCDLEENTAYADNIFKGHSPTHIKDADLVIASPAILFQDSGNRELLEAKKLGKLLTWQEFLGKYLARGKKIIAIAGTHGKSTTTAMAGKLLVDASYDPLVVLGAKVPGWKGNSRFGKGKYFVIEADEFNNNFLNYHPDIAIINNIEFDHPDYFKTEKEVFESFKNFTRKLTGEKVLIVNSGSSGVQKLLELIGKEELKGIKLYTYSLEGTHHSTGCLEIGNTKYELGVPGEYNLANSLGIITLAAVLKIDKRIIQKTLKNFSGIGRRSEMISNKNGIEIYDDYAHHPTAIAATLSGIRETHPNARIWAIDEPHGYARTKALLDKYQGVFKDADKVIIGPIFKARDSETFGVNAKSIAESSKHSLVQTAENLEEILSVLKKEAEKGDIIIVMGAGKSYLWAREIAKIFAGGKKDSVKIIENKSFKDLTTFRVGGKIKYYIEVKNNKEIDEAVCFAKKKGLPIFIIGGGSDVLISDKDFKGVAIKSVGTGIKTEGETIKAEAGVNWDDLVDYCVTRGFQGIECLSGIPGSTGAAPIQNIGAYGQELKNVFISLTAYDIDKEEFVEFNNTDCKFGYRESIFKRSDHWQKFIITDITLKLKKGVKPEVKYDSLKKYLTENEITAPTLQEVRDAVITVRAGKFENPKEVGNAGSFFKNPIIGSITAEKLLKEFPEMPARPQEGGNYKGSAAWFIEQAGWKGKNYKSAGVSPKHALVLINPKGNAKTSDLIELSDRIIDDVNKKFGVKLEREVQVINL